MIDVGFSRFQNKFDWQDSRKQNKIHIRTMRYSLQITAYRLQTVFRTAKHYSPHVTTFLVIETIKIFTEIQAT